jgi:hypothetical protein
MGGRTRAWSRTGSGDDVAAGGIDVVGGSVDASDHIEGVATVGGGEVGKAR